MQRGWSKPMKAYSRDTKVHCPLVGKEIIRLICEDVSLAAEGMQPVRFAPEEFRDTSDWKNTCMKCSKHPE